jgi:hypothetical protein
MSRRIMPSLTALLHTHNDALRLGRALETLYACDQIVIVDHNSHDGTARIARQYGASVVAAAEPHNNASGSEPILALFARIGMKLDGGWILCLTPRESVSESLATSLFELKLRGNSDSNPESQQNSEPYSLFLREETAHGWVDHPTPHTRIVPYTWSHWTGERRTGERWTGALPVHDPAALALEGELLRFTLP